MTNTAELRFRKAALLEASRINRVTFAKFEGEYGFRTDGREARVSETAHSRYSFADIARSLLLAWMIEELQMGARSAISTLNSCFPEVGEAIAQAKASVEISGEHNRAGGPWIIIRDVRAGAVSTLGATRNVRGPFWFAWSRDELMQAIEAGVFGIIIDFAGIEQRAALAEMRVAGIEAD